MRTGEGSDRTLSTKWWVVFGGSLVAAAVATAVGFLRPNLDGFAQNLLAEAAGLGFGMAIAVLLIDGATQTRERRLRKVVSMAARRVAQLNEEIAVMLSTEIGAFLKECLNSNSDLYGDERGNWDTFKPLLSQIFHEATKVLEKGRPTETASLPEEDYKSFVNSASSFVARVRQALGSNFEVQAELFEVVKHLDRLDDCVSKANWPSTARDEKARFAALGDIGNAIIDIVEATPHISLPEPR